MSQTLDEEIRILRTHYWSSRDPDGRAFAPLADAYRRKGELDEAGSLVRDGLGRLPEFATGHLVAARVSRDRGDLVEARNHLDRVVDLDSQNVAALFERARLAGMEGDREQALADLRELLELEPTHSEARSALEELEGSVAWSAETTSDDTEGQGASLEELDLDVAPAPDSAEIESTWDHDPFDLDFAAPAPRNTEAPPEPEPELELEPESEAHVSGFEPELSGAELEPTDSEPETEAYDGETPAAPSGHENGMSDAPMPEAASTPTGDSGSTSDEAVAGEPEDDQSMFTRTMGEIYARQGFLDRAVEIFERLSRRDPADGDLAARLQELRRLAGDAGGGPAPAGPLEPAAPDEAEPVGATADGDRPARTIAGYFDDLLAWEPGAVPIESLAPDAVPIESLAPDAVEVESLAPEPSGAAGGPGSAPDGESRPDVEGGEKDDDQDDDDFNEFQSWLESLRS